MARKPASKAKKGKKMAVKRTVKRASAPKRRPAASKAKRPKKVAPRKATRKAAPIKTTKKAAKKKRAGGTGRESTLAQTPFITVASTTSTERAGRAP